MDRDQALKKFVNEHLVELSDQAATKEVVKRMRQQFFQRFSLTSTERFSNGEVAESLATTVAKVRRSKPALEVTTLLLSIPFIKEELGEQNVSEIVSAARTGEAPQLTVEDLSKIGREGYLEGLEQKFRDRAQAAAEAQLEEEKTKLNETLALLKQQQETLNHAVSQLESVPPDADLELLVGQEPSESAATEAPVWWKELGLESDPFSSNRGLSDIPEAKYDDVVVRTPFVQSYVNKIEKYPESFLGKTVVVLGEFGSGKTTLFQLMASKAVTRGLLPIITSLHPDVSVSRLTTQLIGQLQEALIQAFPHLANGAYTEGAEGTDDIGRALHALTEIIRRTPTTRGFLLFVDGLHKTEAYLKQSIEFLSQLQTLQERFELRTLRLGILVAGSPRWETELKANPSLSGSFYSIDSIPPISEDQAVESVIRRVRSFTPAGGSPPTIARVPLRTAYQVLAQRLLYPPTFRHYLDHVRDRFVARDYSTLGVSIKLHVETVKRVRTLVGQTSLGKSHAFLIDKTQHGPRLLAGLRRVLPEICERKGISDLDPFVSTYKGVFVLLMRQGWIVKRFDTKSGTLAWHLSTPVVEFLQSLETPPNRVLPSEALEALFTEVKEIAPGEAESIYEPIIRQMEAMVAAWRAGLPEVADLVTKAMQEVKKIDAKCRLEEGASSADISEEVRTSFSNVVRAINLVVTGSDAAGSSALETFRGLWCAPENFGSMVQTSQRATAFDPSKSETFGALLNHAQALSDLCELLSSVVRGEGVCRLTGRTLSAVEFERFHAARTLFLSQQYQSSLDKVCDLVEGKIRDTIHVALRCKVGSRLNSLIPPDIRERLKDPARGHPRAKRGADRNFLYDVNRSEYAKILLGGETRRVLFDAIVTNEELPKLRNDLELLFSLGDRDAHRDRPSYFREKATEIATVLQAAPRLCEVMNRTVAHLVEGPFELDRSDGGITFIYGKKGGEDAEHHLSSEEVRSLVSEVLGRLEGGEIMLPPLEPPLIGLPFMPEIGLGGIRACRIQELLTIDKVQNAFGYRVALSEKGQDRLKNLRKKAGEDQAG